jgi:hypothetical protein
MGLLIKLENGDTSLKSLKFGKDRSGGGDSGQPYIQTPINGESGISTSGNTDFLLRGGIQAPSRAVDDVARLTKYMFSTKSPSGLLFIAKQNLLSRVSPKTESSKGPGYAGGSLNAGVYTPLSTLAQAGVGYLGIHLNKQGLSPFDGSPLSINKYEDVVKKNNEPGVNILSQTNGQFSNRLLNVWYNKQFQIKTTQTLTQDPFPVTSKLGTTPSLIPSDPTPTYSSYVDVYDGGPGSVLGIGKTRIRFADQRTGNQNPDLRTSGFFSTLNDFGYYDYGVFKPVRSILYKGASIFNGKTVSSKYEDITGDSLLENYSTTNNSDKLQNFTVLSTKTDSLYTESDESIKLRKDPREGSRTFNTEILLKGITSNSTYKPIGELNTGLNINPNANTIFNFFTSSTKTGSLKDESDESIKLRKDPREGSRTFNTEILLKGITSNSTYTSIGKLDTGLNTGSQVNTIFKFPISSTQPGSLKDESKESTKLRKDPRRGSRTFNTKTLLKGITTNSAYKPIGELNTGLNIGSQVNTIFKFPISSTQPGSLYTESDESTKLRDKGRINSNNTLFSDDQKTATPNNQPTYLASLNNKYPNSGSGEPLNNAFAIETRLALGDPGRVKGSFSTVSSLKGDILDKINASPIYTGSLSGKNSKDYNDLVSFRIGIIDPTSPNTTRYMNFRAYIDSFSDSYSATWKGQRYMGRAEQFYKYDGFGRDISLAFTVVAHSQGEMHGMYQKLNFLASSLAPTYTTSGYMAGNLAKLTLGDYIHEQPGFISSITYDIPEDSSWEISLTPKGQISGTQTERNAGNPDELPFMIKVTGFKFTPIHTFRPEIQPNPITGSENRFITNNLDFNRSWHSSLES